MPERIFDTYHASDEEIDSLKTALDEAGITYYETHKGRWGVGSAGLWVHDKDQHDEARKVILSFQEDWSEKIRQQPIETGIRWRMVPLALLIVAAILYLNLHWLY